MLRIASFEGGRVIDHDDGNDAAACSIDAKWTEEDRRTLVTHPKEGLIDAPMSVPIPVTPAVPAVQTVQTVQAMPVYFTSNNPTLLAHGRRKSVPSRSASRDDIHPGVVFRMDNSEIHLLNTFACWTGRPSTNMPQSYQSSQYSYLSSQSQPQSQPQPLPALRNEREEVWDWASPGRCPSSGGAFNGGGLVTGKGSVSGGRGASSEQPPQRIVTTRQRSFSLTTERPKLSQAEQIGLGLGQAANEASDSDSEPYYNGPSPINPSSTSNSHSHSNATSNQGPKRRSSIACGQGSLNVYTGSLAHLVPNAYLQTTSRRISTHSSAPGCLCTSCGSTVTPYWRDGWSSNVMLCNACGLRFQKFARRCPACMYIPRKEDSLGDRCIKCNNFWIVGPAS